MNKKAKGKLLTRLNELSSNVSDSDEKMATEFLTELGINTEEEAAFGLKEIQRLHFLVKAHHNQSRDSSLLTRLQEKIKESFLKNATLTGEILQNALVQRRASFQFRNIENWTEDEMREVLTDVDLTKLLEDLDKLPD
jgi:hypothetical protein